MDCYVDIFLQAFHAGLVALPTAIILLRCITFTTGDSRVIDC